MDNSSITERDLILLEKIEQNPDVNQASLASQLGVAVGTVNWHLRRMIDKGYVKVRRLERKKLRYIITPEGLALRARLTVDFIQTSFRMYRLVRERMVEVLDEVEKAGFHQVILKGDGEIGEVCQLTCLEREIDVVEKGHVPQLEIQGLKIELKMPAVVKDETKIGQELENG
jgi:DNA-binding MarR family transcriptional regulator